MTTAQDNYQGVWGNRIGFGQRPALLMIDFMQGYTTEGAPLFAPCWLWWGSDGFITIEDIPRLQFPH